MMVTANKYSLTDVPRDISKGEKDKLGIGQYEVGLTQFIEHANTPITIALQGEWGSGKTSLMNTLRNNLCEGDQARFFGVWINTWEYSLMRDATTALAGIVNGLVKSIAQFAGHSPAKTLGDKVLKFGLMAFAAAFNRGSDVVKEILSNENKSSISEIRTELETVINECVQKHEKQGIIFFIDDLDRIDPPIAVQLLELLKNLFTFGHCIFVLAIDYDVVIKGLEPKFGTLSEKNEREFRSFFDKIIQVPFSMPVTRYQIDEFLKESLLSIHYLTESQSQNKDLITVFSEISNLSVGTNPRALKRLLNSLLLIRCINNIKDDEQADSELELLVNFTLVSIQIAFPSIYRLLSSNPGFDKWDDEMLARMDLSPVKLQNENKSKWEQILFRLCENDYYLKMHFLNISGILNRLKTLIENNGETVEDYISDLISLSSVTNLDAFNNPPIDNDVHISSFLKDLRTELIARLKKRLPDIARQITSQGKRVKSNAFIKFPGKDDKCWVKLHAQFTGNGIELDISAKSSDRTEKIILLSADDFKQEDNLHKITEIICKLYNGIFHS
jgi:predicted KAP-like P-loop ATPase